MKLTVFTPTYNRGYIIENLYRSLQRQTFHDFEWLVVDDGSTDNTEELFARYMMEENAFPIRYIKTKNGGKHRAINKGVPMAQGELFYIVDSDDYLPDDALQIICDVEATIPENEKQNFGGVCGERGVDSTHAIGSTFSGEVLDITMLERPLHHIAGDKAEVFYTSILKKYPFPEFEGENFVTECVIWDKIASDGYKLRFFNKIVMVTEYREDGLTAQGNALFLKNPHGYGLYIYQCGEFGKLCGLNKWNKYLYFYYAMRKKMRFREIAESLCTRPAYLWIRLLGMKIFYKLYDR